MANLVDYIKWRGDISFNNSPVNEVDELIFSQLAYLNLENIVPFEYNKSVTLSDAAKIYFAQGRIIEGLIMSEELQVMFMLMAQSERFSKVELFGFRNIIDEKNEKQFSAISVNIGKAIFVAFRGTDDTIVGWKEDFNLAFLDSVPSQKEAVSYLENVMKTVRFMPFYICGHSKGGNLSIYSAMNVKDKYKSRIKAIYNNDGPGFSEKIVNSEKYKNIAEKIVTIVPEGTIVGQLLNAKKPDVIVKSNMPMLVQHDAFSWEVMGAAFLRAEALSENSIKIKSVLNSWFNGTSKDEREVFVETLFEMLSASEAKTLTDINNDWLGFFMGFSRVDKEKKKELRKNFGKILEEVARLTFKKD